MAMFPSGETQESRSSTGRLVGKWTFGEQVGKGVSGETYLVRSADGREGVLKRPKNTSTASERAKEAMDIAREGTILERIGGFSHEYRGIRVRVIGLLDRSIEGPENPQKFFIVQEKASGISLKNILDVRRGISVAQPVTPVAQIASNTALLRLILIKAAVVLLDFFSHLHSRNPPILWNDVKDEHIYWNAEQNEFVLIDWGNSQFLDEKGESKDKKFYSLDDYKIFLSRYGGYFQTVDPQLYSFLQWPDHPLLTAQIKNEADRVKVELEAILDEEEARVHEIRLNLNALYSRRDISSPEEIQKIIELNKDLLALGEGIDYKQLRLIITSTLKNFIRRKSFDTLQASMLISGVFVEQASIWQLITRLIPIFKQGVIAENDFLDLIDHAYDGACAELVWLLCRTAEKSPKVADPLKKVIRQIRDHVYEAGNITPRQGAVVFLEEIKRLEASITREDFVNKTELAQKYDLIKEIQDILALEIERWEDPDVPPGHSLIDHPLLEVFRLQDLPINFNSVPDSFLQSLREAVNGVKASWNAGRLEEVVAMSKRLLLLDPDRMRLLRIADEMDNVRNWKARIAGLSDPDSPELDSLEINAKMIQGRMGASEWFSQDISEMTRQRETIRRQKERRRLEEKRREEENLREEKRRLTESHKQEELRGQIKASRKTDERIWQTNPVRPKFDAGSEYFNALRENRTKDVKKAILKQQLPENIRKQYENLAEQFINVIKPGGKYAESYHFDQEIGADWETLSVLETLKEWRRVLAENGLDPAQKILDKDIYTNWTQYHEASKIQNLWNPYTKLFASLSILFSQLHRYPQLKSDTQLEEGKDILGRLYVARGCFSKDNSSPDRKNLKVMREHLEVAWKKLSDLQEKTRKPQQNLPLFSILSEAHDWRVWLDRIGEVIDHIKLLQKYPRKRSQQINDAWKALYDFFEISQIPEVESTGSCFPFFLLGIVLVFLAISGGIIYKSLFDKGGDKVVEPTVIVEDSITSMPSSSIEDETEGDLRQPVETPEHFSPEASSPDAQRQKWEEWLYNPPDDLSQRQEWLNNEVINNLGLQSPDIDWADIKTVSDYQDWLRVILAFCEIPPGKYSKEARNALTIVFPEHLARYADGEKAFSLMCGINPDTFIRSIDVGDLSDINLMGQGTDFPDEGCISRAKRRDPLFLQLDPGESCTVPMDLHQPSVSQLHGVTIELCINSQPVEDWTMNIAIVGDQATAYGTLGMIDGKSLVQFGNSNQLELNSPEESMSPEEQSSPYVGRCEEKELTELTFLIVGDLVFFTVDEEIIPREKAVLVPGAFEKGPLYLEFSPGSQVAPINFLIKGFTISAFRGNLK